VARALSVLIALLDEADAGRVAAREAVARSQVDHDLLIPVTAFSEPIVAPYRRSRRDGQRAEEALASLGRLVEVTRDIASHAVQSACNAPDQAARRTDPRDCPDRVRGSDPDLDQRWRGAIAACGS